MSWRIELFEDGRAVIVRERPGQDDPAKIFICDKEGATFATEHGLAMHKGKMHKGVP